MIPWKPSDRSLSRSGYRPFSYHFSFPEDEPHRGGGGEVCGLSLHRRGNGMFVRSNVTGDVLDLLASAIPGEAIGLASEDIEGLSALCGKLQFRSLPQFVEAIKNTTHYRLGHGLARRDEKVQAHRNDASALMSKMDSLKSAQRSFAPLRTLSQSSVGSSFLFSGAASRRFVV
jgi:hypothetical protein